MAAELLDSNVIPGSLYGYFVGLVENTGNADIGVQVTVAFFDEQGNPTGTFREDTLHRVVLPGEISPAVFALTRRSQIRADYQVSLEMQSANPRDDLIAKHGIDPHYYRGFQVLEAQFSEDPEGRWDYLITGKIMNSGDVPVSCPVVSTVVFDEAHRIIAFPAGGMFNPALIIDKWDLRPVATEPAKWEPFLASWEPFMPGKVSTFSLPIIQYVSGQPTSFLLFPLWKYGGCPW